MDRTWIWSQAPGIDPARMPLLALRRWCSSVTLCSPEAVPSRFGLWAALAALGVLLLMVVVARGPKGTVVQILDAPGHWDLLRAALGRLKRSPRLMVVLLASAVLSWTGWELLGFTNSGRIEDLAFLLRTKSASEAGAEQAYLAALTPLRDVAALGDLWPLLVAASLVVFKVSADRWGMVPGDDSVLRAESPPRWTSAAWTSGFVYAMYRAVQDIKSPDGLPVGGFVLLEAAFVPLLMLSADGLLLGWVMAEIARARPDQPDSSEGLAVTDGLRLMPLAMLACLSALPARYSVPAVWLALPHLREVLAPEQVVSVASFLRGHGLIAVQAASLAVLGLAGATALGSGCWRRSGRILRDEGGRLLVWSAILCTLVGAVSGLATWLVLSMPPQAWVLAAADAYAHLASFPLGLVLLSGLIELARRVEPEPPSRPEPPPEPAGLVFGQLETTEFNLGG